jgi:hypothetical protein
LWRSSCWRVPSLAIVPAICCWLPASWSTLCRKRARPREARLPSDGRIAPRAEPAIASSPGRAAPRSWGNSGGVGVTLESIGTSPLSSSRFAVTGHHPVARPRPTRGGRTVQLMRCANVRVGLKPVVLWSSTRQIQGRIVGASKIARDITEQTRAREQIATLAREAEHRSKNLLASVQATVRLS